MIWKICTFSNWCYDECVLCAYRCAFCACVTAQLCACPLCACTLCACVHGTGDAQAGTSVQWDDIHAGLHSLWPTPRQRPRPQD